MKTKITDLAIFGGVPSFAEPVHVGRPNLGDRQQLIQRVNQMLDRQWMKVSICMVTYNHESYIAKAVESIIAHKTNFVFEIVIGEDSSTDKTKLILIDYC